MRTTTLEALCLSCAMGAVILFCRAFPFLFFAAGKSSRSKGISTFLDFVERIAPPAAMTVLVFNSLGPSFQNIVKGAVSALSAAAVNAEFSGSLAAIIAAALTALTYFWKRNALISIFGGTALYMILVQWAVQ